MPFFDMLQSNIVQHNHTGLVHSERGGDFRRHLPHGFAVVGIDHIVFRRSLEQRNGSCFLPLPHPLRPLNQRGGIRFRPQFHFLFMGKHAVEHVPHFVAQFDMQIERVPVHAHEPFAEAGKHAFELRRGSLAFPQVLFKTAREHFLFGAAARVFLQIVGQGVKFRAAVSGMFLIAVVFRLQRRVVIHGRRPLPQGGKIGQHPFVGQPFPFQPFHLQKEDMGRLVGEGGQVRAPEKPDDVIARSVKRGGSEGGGVALVQRGFDMLCCRGYIYFNITSRKAAAGYGFRRMTDRGYAAHGCWNPLKFFERVLFCLEERLVHDNFAVAAFFHGNCHGIIGIQFLYKNQSITNFGVSCPSIEQNFIRTVQDKLNILISFR